MSQPLPPHPSLDQLKQQAKDLLKAYRAGDPAVRRLFPAGAPTAPGLAAAQHLLAGRYGFASWPKLKQHIEHLLARRQRQAASRTRRLAQQQRIQAKAEQLLAAVQQSDARPVFQALFAPNSDMLALRAYLIAHESYTVVIGALLRAAADPGARTRFLAAQAMDHFADARCVEPLQQLLHDPVPRVRWAALHSLACDDCKLEPLHKPAELRQTIANLALHDPSIKVRRVATWELGKYVPETGALAALQTLSQSADAAIRRNARAGLRHQVG